MYELISITDTVEITAFNCHCALIIRHTKVIIPVIETKQSLWGRSEYTGSFLRMSTVSQCTLFQLSVNVSYFKYQSMYLISTISQCALFQLSVNVPYFNYQSVYLILTINQCTLFQLSVPWCAVQFTCVLLNTCKHCLFKVFLTIR